MRNKSVKTRVRNVVKSVRQAVAEGAEDVAEKLRTAQSVIDKAAKKGVIHKNTAGRKISRLNQLVNKTAADQSTEAASEQESPSAA